MSKPIKNVERVRTQRLKAAVQLVEKYAKRMNLPDEVVKLSREILRRYDGDYIPYLSRTFAAGALYVATSILGVKTKSGKRITQELISKKTGATDASIRNAYEDIVRNVKMDVLLSTLKGKV